MILHMVHICSLDVKWSLFLQRNNLVALYRNDKEDSELRIMAYLQVIKCPTDPVIQQVKDTLKAEEVNQVIIRLEFYENK